MTAIKLQIYISSENDDDTCLTIEEARELYDQLGALFNPEPVPPAPSQLSPEELKLEALRAMMAPNRFSEKTDHFPLDDEEQARVDKFQAERATIRVKEPRKRGWRQVPG